MIDLNKVKVDEINYGALKIYEYGVELQDEGEFMLDSQVKNIFNRRFDLLKINLYLDEVFSGILAFNKVYASEEKLIYSTGVNDEEKLTRLIIEKDLQGNLEYSIEEVSVEGGGGGTAGAPVFNAEITEESGKVDVSMSEEDKNDIYSHKYPIIGIHIIDEEENDIVLYFKLRIRADEANALVYDNWDGGDGEISQLELTFVWDGDDVKITFESNDYSYGASEYTVIDFDENDQSDQAKLAEVYNTCPQLLRIHSNNEGLQMYRLEVDDKDLHNAVHYSCLIGGALIELSFTESSGTYTLGVNVYGLTPANS